MVGGVVRVEAIAKSTRKILSNQPFLGTGLAWPARAANEPPIFTHVPLATSFQALP